MNFSIPGFNRKNHKILYKKIELLYKNHFYFIKTYQNICIYKKSIVEFIYINYIITIYICLN